MTTLIDGTYNSRDTGGTPLVGGGATRTGVLYRSDALIDVTVAGERTLADSTIGTVVDLRTEAERVSAPNRLPNGRPFRTEALSIIEGAMAIPAGLDLRAFDPDAMAQMLTEIPTLADLYLGMLAHAASSFAQVARLVAAPEDSQHGGVLIHCTAGKDRTGVATALLLDAVGADRDAVIADYAASEVNLAGTWAQGMLVKFGAMGVPPLPPVVALMTSTPPDAIATALRWLDDQGGSAAYLRGGGLGDEELVALRTRLAG
ncbi:hypothetical protein GCM10025768_27840 [Microbacterium pseudoresistens]|uniref:Protein-tyrosine phosphatase n=1 Tax=Microbacterium pseudoresistens TaxID=640634 RepID=A0A7Y9JNM3_9MICO|nr:tyrosine-protein phosphatase [Microbacterium pseudoresistens]NYD54683.1 protein-tyrosine phosphatase [Microbacterium pseudoresistens]